MFYPQVTVSADFDWLSSKILAIKAKYNHPKSGDGWLPSRWIRKPDYPQPMTQILGSCHMTNKDPACWNTRFFINSNDTVGFTFAIEFKADDSLLTSGCRSTLQIVTGINVKY